MLLSYFVFFTHKKIKTNKCEPLELRSLLSISRKETQNIPGCDSWGWKCCLLELGISSTIIKEATVWPPNTPASASVIQSHITPTSTMTVLDTSAKIPSIPCSESSQNRMCELEGIVFIISQSKLRKSLFHSGPWRDHTQRHGSRAGTAPGLTDLQSSGRD